MDTDPEFIGKKIQAEVVRLWNANRSYALYLQADDNKKALGDESDDGGHDGMLRMAEALESSASLLIVLAKGLRREAKKIAPEEDDG